MVTIHMTTLASRSVRTGLRPRPRRATAIPPTMKPRLVMAIRMPHASTDISVRPYGSISDMNTPPRKLLNVENSRSANSPGTSLTAWIAPARSITRGASALGSGASSSIRIVRRWTAAMAVRTTAIEQARPHPELADRQAAEHRGDREGDPVGRADQPVRPVALVLGHQERHGRGQRDRAQVAGDRADEHEDDERPESQVLRGPGAPSPARRSRRARQARRPRARSRSRAASRSGDGAGPRTSRRTSRTRRRGACSRRR